MEGIGHLWTRLQERRFGEPWSGHLGWQTKKVQLEHFNAEIANCFECDQNAWFKLIFNYNISYLNILINIYLEWNLSILNQVIYK